MNKKELKRKVRKLKKENIALRLELLLQCANSLERNIKKDDKEAVKENKEFGRRYVEEKLKANGPSIPMIVIDHNRNIGG